MQSYIRSAFIIAGIILLQTTYIPFISLSGFTPDLILIYLVYLALQRGQIEATITGFVIGIIEDTIAMNFFGLCALSKTIAGFVAGYFFNENLIEQNLGSYRYVLIVALCSLIHNLVYFFFFFQGSESTILILTLEFTFGMSLYTIIVGVIPMFFFSQKYKISWVQ